MPHFDPNEPKKYSWEWFRDKAIEHTLNAVMLGLCGVIAWAFVQVYIGDFKLEKFKTEEDEKIRKMNNETIEREGEIVKQIQELKNQIGNKTPELPPLPPPPSLGSPHNQMNVQQHPDSTKLEWIEKHTKK